MNVRLLKVLTSQNGGEMRVSTEPASGVEERPLGEDSIYIDATIVGISFAPTAITATAQDAVPNVKVRARLR